MPTTGYQPGDILHSPRPVADNNPVLIHGRIFHSVVDVSQSVLGALRDEP